MAKVVESELSNFQYIWKEWITPLIDDIFEQIDVDFVKQTNLKKRDLKSLGKAAEKFFLKKRHLLKIEYYGNNYKADESVTRLMDFHKLSAVLCRTLVEYKVFEFDINACWYIAQSKEATNTDWLVKNALVNYRVAFFASVVFLYQSMLYLNYESNVRIFEGLKERKKLDLYSHVKDSTLNRVHESFENCMVLNIAKRNINGRSFDLLTYASLMYQLEEYNKVLILNDSER